MSEKARQVPQLADTNYVPALVIENTRGPWTLGTSLVFSDSTS